MAPPFLETNQAGEIYYETSWDEQWSPKYMPPDEVGVEFIAIPSDSDIAKIGSLSIKERELVDEIKWRITHKQYSWEELTNHSIDPLPYSSRFERDFGYIALFTELRRGYENTNAGYPGHPSYSKRPRLRFEKDWGRVHKDLGTK